jgi:dTDP-4-amino-4,6-dideoxygalactose transaminase
MSKEKIWLSPPHMGGTEQKYIQEAFVSNWIAPVGKNIDEFEFALEGYLSNRVKIAVTTSGTAAIHLALIQAGVGHNDTVICQSNSHIASANPITYQGATPVFVDSEKDTWNMSPELLEKAIKDLIKNGTKPKAIIVVHLYGMPAKMEEIQTIAEKYNIPVIEDAAEALGSTYKGKKCGTLGNFGILSFNGNKIITTSGGGALVCQTKEAKEKTIFLSTQARDTAPHYQHTEIGYNYRMSNIVAGIGRGQMQVLDSRVEARRKNYEYYRSKLKNTTIEFIQEPDKIYANRWLTTILTDSFTTREKIRLALEKENIEARPLWKPMHLQPVFKEAKAYVNGVSEDLFNRGLCLPSGSNLSQNDLQRVVEEVKRVVSYQ